MAQKSSLHFKIDVFVDIRTWSGTDINVSNAKPKILWQKDQTYGNFMSFHSISSWPSILIHIKHLLLCFGDGTINPRNNIYMTANRTCRVNVVLEQLPASADNVVLWWAGTCSRFRKKKLRKKKRRKNDRLQDTFFRRIVENQVRALLGPAVPERSAFCREAFVGFLVETGEQSFNHEIYGKTHLNHDFRLAFQKRHKKLFKSVTKVTAEHENERIAVESTLF